MLRSICAKLPMRDKAKSLQFYVDQLGFQVIGNYPDYLLLQKDNIELHLFAFAELDPRKNYGQVYIRVSDIDEFYNSLLNNKVAIHPAGQLQNKAWGQREFALLDPDHNLLSFGEAL